MAFQPFQQLYQHIKKSDSLLFQTLDKIAGYLQGFANSIGSISNNTIPKGDNSGNLVDSTISELNGTVTIRHAVSGLDRPTLLLDSLYNTNARFTRFFNANRLDLTTNVYFDGTNILLEDVTKIGMRLILDDSSGLRIFKCPAAPNPATNILLGQLDINGNLILLSIISNYNNVNTIGMGVPPIYQYDAILGSAAAIGPFNLAVGGGIAPAGLYRVCLYLKTTIAGVGNIQFFVTWSDNIGGKVVQTNMAFLGNAFAQNTIILNTAGAIHINYFSIYAGPGTYDTYITLERLT